MCSFDCIGRNADYQKLNIEFTVEIVKAAVAIKAFPEFLRPLVIHIVLYVTNTDRSSRAAARIFSNVRTCTQRCADHLSPIINHRREKQLELGDQWDDRPVSFPLPEVEIAAHWMTNRTIC